MDRQLTRDEFKVVDIAFSLLRKRGSEVSKLDLDRAARMGYVALERQIGRDPRTSVATLDFLSTRMIEARKAIAYNVNTLGISLHNAVVAELKPKRREGELVVDPDPDVFMQAAVHPHAYDETLALLAGCAEGPPISREKARGELDYRRENPDRGRPMERMKPIEESVLERERKLLDDLKAAEERQ